VEALAPAADVRSVREVCRRVLERGDLAAKLSPPPPGLADAERGPALRVRRPARAAGLRLRASEAPLPRPPALRDAAARARCLARFAHHELMAVELFAWALLRWPELAPELRRGLFGVLADEQRHCRLYLARLAALGSQLEEHPASDYFWRFEPALDAAPAGPRAFLCGMGLTLEQANLDFSLLYADAFRAAGDAGSARACERVHADEVRHVALAAVWLRRLADPGVGELAAYLEAVPFPLGAARAKGRRFDAAARRRAGLSPELIEHVREARSTAELAGSRAHRGAP
jgi:uncharacterized ferritin-like protein (DUF455 family)